MRNLRTNMDAWFEKMDERWLALPIRKQHRDALYFFTEYLLLTAGVIFKVWDDTAKSYNNMIIDHIETPVLSIKESPALLQDTLQTILKNKIYERK